MSESKKTLLILRDWLTFPIILVLSYFLIIEPYFDKKDKAIIENREYSIAHILKRYDYAEKAKGGQYGTGTSLASVDFSYSHKGQDYKANCNITSENGHDRTINEYLLLVDKDDPDKFILLFDYPINDKVDFQQIIKKYEKENFKNAP